MSKKFIETSDNNEVMIIIYNYDDLKEDERQELVGKGYLTELEVPKPTEENKICILHFTTDRGFYYEYKDIPKSKEELIIEQINSLNIALAELMGL
ncbi:hypothetical protein [uncultured Clostridium sp.]|uniref:hypothetical protein n=1 Tax=uncultured Clostridium sp. TaxID=59620 RepID=UPI0028EB0854|nr:hypothetical protein [uncultured Clostridium sp.]